MKILTYYTLLLALIGSLTSILIKTNQISDSMSMGTMVSVSIFLILYVIGVSIVGEIKSEDERAVMHRFTANRIALIVGILILSIAIIYQLFTHTLDHWLLYALIGINISKIGSLIYQHYKK